MVILIMVARTMECFTDALRPTVNKPDLLIRSQLLHGKALLNCYMVKSMLLDSIGFSVVFTK